MRLRPYKKGDNVSITDKQQKANAETSANLQTYWFRLRI